jgi:hypothetical protein
MSRPRRPGDRKVLETERDELGEMQADEVRGWAVSGTFTTTATRFRVSMIASFVRASARHSATREGVATKRPAH